MSQLREIFTDVFTNWRFGGWPESKSGGGSTLDATEVLRRQIRELVKDLDIKTVVDLPCGDFNWMKEIVYGFEHYTGCDIVPELIEKNQRYSNSIIDFKVLDATVDEIPTADLLITRDLLGHLSLEDGKKVLDNILRSNCKYLLSTTWYNKNDESYHLTHVNKNNDVTLDRQWEVGAAAFYPVCLLSEPFNLQKPKLYLEESVVVDGYDSGVRKGLALWNLEELRNTKPTHTTENLTVVTGLWNISRAGRSFDHYIENFSKFLDMPVNMFIYVPAELEYLVWKKRDRSNTHVRTFELNDIRSNLYSPFWENTQNIRTSDAWLNQTGENGWLRTSPQASNEWYNPIVQSKMFMLHDAKVLNVFDTDYFVWLDAGITNTVYEKYFTENRCLDNIIPLLDTFLFLSYPYDAVNEIHGFEYSALNRLSKQKVKYVCRGGLFGGHKDYISIANSTYYALLDQTLRHGYMGTEESLFSIMAHLEPHIYRRFALDGNGLVVKFVQALLDGTAQLEEVSGSGITVPRRIYNPSKHKTSLYVLGYNFPMQFRALISSFQNHPEWLEHPRKILINNSDNQDAIREYDVLCKEFGFEHIITGENLGINRGRVFAAKHFHESDSDYYFFFEDDMFLHNKTTTTFCRNGFRQYIPNLYRNVHEIMSRDGLDFLKLSYTEVYMDNNIQVSWYNVPQVVRTELWPHYDQLPVSGLDPFAPRTKFDKIEVFNELSYITGDIYYANWPMIVSKEGNKKMFIDVTWEHPYEQTLMSYMFQETRKGNIKPAVLLASPINHNRIFHYRPEERREN